MLLPVGLHTSTPVRDGSVPGRQEGRLWAAFPTANTTKLTFSHGEHQVPSGPSDGGARGEETVAPTPFRVADSHFSPYISPSSLPGRFFPPQNLPELSLFKAS